MPYIVKSSTDLTAKSREQIKAKNFALPERRYPIHDESHARAALSMVAAHGSPEEKSTVRSAVARRYPGIEQTKEGAERETRKGWAVSTTREGRRPMSVDTLLRKEKDGTLGGHDVGAFRDPTRIPSRDDELPYNQLRKSPTGPITPEIKEAFVAPDLSRLQAAGRQALGTTKGLVNQGLDFVQKHENPIEVAGLGYLAAPNVDNMQAKLRARAAGLGDGDGHVSGHDLDRFRLIPEAGHDFVEASGLGTLAAPLISKRLRTGSWH